ncbi:hypothetical protein ACGFNU_23690 [Spirillospora sp. NPDC048911]|uniref:hypothetical protein n=1 Tax=Spirillospora sp. NPDC048911 TaxID=3364527 RepID=UPI0037187B4A
MARRRRVVAFAGTGHSPFEGQLVPEILYKVVHERPGLDGLDPALREVVEAALAKDPADRPSVPELLELLAGRPRSGAAPSTTRPARSGVMAIGGVAALVFVAVTAIAALIIRPWDGTPPAGGDAYARYVGMWTGSVDHRRGGKVVSTFEATLTIERGRPGQIVGTSDYASLNCNGALKLIDMTGEALRGTETIGQGSCTPVVTITLSAEKDGTLGYSYTTVNNEGTGRLHKIQ